MGKDTSSNKNNNFDSEKSFHELGAQPRKSEFRAHKPLQDMENSFDDEKSHHRHRDELNKKMVRVQLRRIERLY